MIEATVQIVHWCGQEILIRKAWVPGGVNKTGGYVLKCKGCGGVFAHHLGRDINESSIISGAELLETYDDELGNKASVLAKYGLPG